VLDHQAKVLHDLDPCLRPYFSRRIISNSRLDPNRFWICFKNLIDVLWNIDISTEDIDHVDLPRHITKIAINFLAKNLSYIRVINRYRKDVESRVLHVPRDIKRRL